MADVALRPTFPKAELEARPRRAADVAARGARTIRERSIQFAFPRLVFGPTAPLRHGGDRHRGVAQGDHRRGPAAVPRGALRPVERDADRDRRRDRRRRVVPRLETAFGGVDRRRAAATAPVAGAAAADRAPGLSRRQAGRGAVADPHRLDRRAAIDAGLLRAARAQHDPRRLVHLAAEQNLREEHGYAYGASSTFDMRAAAGPFYAAAGVQTDKTAEALTEFFKELDGIRKPIPADELEKAEELSRAAAAAQFRDDRARRATRSRRCTSTTCRPTTTRRTRSASARSRRRTCSAPPTSTSSRTSSRWWSSATAR